MVTKRSHILKQTCSWKLQVCLSTCDLFVTTRVNPEIVLYGLCAFRKQCHKIFYRQIKKITNIQKLCIQSLKNAPLNKCFWVGETTRPKKVKEGEIFFKLYGDGEKSKFISLEDYIALLLEFFVCDFYNYLPNRFWNYFQVNSFWWIRKTNLFSAKNLFTLFRKMFFYWFMWKFCGDCSRAKASFNRSVWVS